MARGNGKPLGPRLTSLVIHVLLFALLSVVLMPLGWMVITAFKRRGQGINLNPIPETTVVIEAEPVPLNPENPPVTFEFADPDHQYSSISVAGSFNGWDLNASPLRWINGVWTRRFTEGIEPGRYEYKFVANGEQWMGDPANMTNGDPGANSILVVEANTLGNTDLKDASRIERDLLVIDYAAPDLQGLVADVSFPDETRRLVDLTLEDGRWRGETGLPEISAVGTVTIGIAYQHEITFAEAWHQTYTIENFTKILNDPDYPFGQFFMNSLWVATGCGFVTVFLCLLAGYAFAVKKFWMRDQIFWLLFASMLIPGLVFIVPQFAIVNALGWRNSYSGMIFPHVANVFGLFLMRQYIMTLPRDLFDAARVDGASEFQVLRTIVVPLSMPIIVTLFLLTFMLQWSNFLWQLIVNSPDSLRRTLPVGLALFRGQHNIDWELMMAGACFSIIPIAILFILAQRHFIQGLTAGAVKG